jgi:hypothetical protein
MKKEIKTLLLLMTAIMILNVSCRKNDHPGFPCDSSSAENNADLQNAQLIKLGADIPAKWYALAIKLSRTTPNQSPGPINSRAFGYMGLALYESVVPGIPADKSIQSQLNDMPALPQVICGEKYFYPACANAALANMVHHMFGNTSAAQNFTIDSLEQSLDSVFKSRIPNYIFDRSVNFGQSISNAIYAWSTSDGGDQAYLNPFPTTYTPPAGPGLWVPLPGQFAQLPNWGSNRTFIKNNAASTQPPAPPAYSTDPSSQFYKDELEVYNESVNQDPEHIIIAKYWAALPGPGVSISILSSVLASKNSNLSVAAEAYCKVGIAIADAIISCYKTKYQYNQERPITFIRANFNPTWVSTIPTPPFPDYTSAHSVQAGASARVLADIFGNNTTFTDNSINSLGFTPRTFTKFSDCAIEVGLSRLYGGIHVRTSNFVGLDQGNLVGMHVSALHFKRNY